MKKLLPILLILSAFTSFAQRHEIDSMLVVLKTAKEDTNKVKTLFKLCFAFRNIQPDTGLYFGNQTLELAEKLQWKKGMAMARNVIGVNYNIQSNYQKGIDNFIQAAKLFEEVGNKKGEASALQNIGITYFYQKKHDKAIEYTQKALKINQELGIRDTAGNLSNLANIYQIQNDNSNAIKYNLLALKASEDGNDMAFRALVLGNLGEIYTAQKAYAKALKYSLDALQIYNQQPDNNPAVVLRGLGSVYLGLARGDGGKEADSLLQVLFAGNKSSALKMARSYIERSNTLLKDLDNLLFLSENYKMLSEAKELSLDYKGALESYKDYELLKDSVFNMESDKKLTEAGMQYEFDKKDALAQAALQRQLLIRNSFMAGFAVMLLFAGVFFYQRNKIKKSNAALAEAKARAEASEAFKSRFLANMSHEIRTPLHGIAGFTDLVLETSLSEKQRHYLNAIGRSNERLTEVVNDILDLSKLEAGELGLRQTPFSPARIALDVQEALSVRAENKGIALRVFIAEDVPPAVLGDPTRLYQILMNLTGNAVKFTEKGEVRLTIDRPVSDQPDRALIGFTVSDTGIGIPPEKLTTIFDSFQQAENDISARFGGTGLGLTIARELVQLHGSDIRVESEQGKGSSFSFVLALPLADAADLETSSAHKSDLYFSRPLHILLVDDNDFNREIAGEALFRHFKNAQITEAQNGKAALRFLEKQDFDVVLMDMQMPEMNGTEATRIIREQFADGKKNVPVIALSASATPDEINAALSAGMNRHLPKPFKPVDLARAIAATLNLHGDIPGPVSAVPERPEARSAHDKYDLSYLYDFCDGDEAQVRHFIEKFEAQYPLEIRQLETAFEQQDRKAIYQGVHRLKPQLAFVGLNAAAEVAAELEQGAAGEEEMEALADKFQRLKMMTAQA